MLNEIELIKKDGVIVLSSNKDKDNIMTLSFMMLGQMFFKDSLIIFVRKSRFTHKLLMENPYFSINYLNSKTNVNFLAGKRSGYHVDKLKMLGLETVKDGNYKYLKDASKVYLCKLVSKMELNKNNIFDEGLIKKFYSDEDYHDAFLAIIEKRC